ncbi:hypothetical protein EBR43_07015 [bacterium]|nr:hypothetical protein [bacterium]
MALKTIAQLLILSSVSLLSGFLAKELKFSFFLGVGIGLGLQFLVYYIYSNIFTAYILLKNKKLENERIKEFSYQGVEVICPCYKKINAFVPIRMNTDNSYTCQECKKDVAIYIDVSTAVTTQPINNTKEVLKEIVESALTNEHT